MKHEWAFKHSVQMINQNPNVLPRRQLVPQVIRVPAGNRFELGTVTLVQQGLTLRASTC